jgi:SOS-response transcriptional repressor LexA
MISRYESGERTPPLEVVEKFARLPGAPPVKWFFDGKPGPPPEPVAGRPGRGRAKFPLVGSAGAATAPVESEDEPFDATVEFSEDLYHPLRFVIRVRGKSMEDRIKHGDYILVHPDPEPHVGFLTIAKNASHEHVVKVAKLINGRVELHPMATGYPVIVPGEGWETVGYAVGIRRERGKGKYREEGDTDGVLAEEK